MLNSSSSSPCAWENLFPGTLSKWKRLSTAQCFQPKAAEWPDCKEGSEKTLQRMMSPPRMSVCWVHLFCTLRSNQAAIQTGHFWAIWSMSYLWMHHVVCAQEGWLFYQKPSEWRSPAGLTVGGLLIRLPLFCLDYFRSRMYIKIEYL